MRRIISFLLSVTLLSVPSLCLGKGLPKIAVWDLAAGNVPSSHAQDLTSILVSEIVKIKKYEVYSQENIRTIAGWTEDRLKPGCINTSCLLALGQMDIAKLVSGRVGKIGNTFSVSLNLFDTQKARAENAISEFCRTEDELIQLIQWGARKLLGVPSEALSPPGSLPAKPGTLAGLPSQTSTLEIHSRIQGVRVYFNGQDWGEGPRQVMNVPPGLHEIRVVKWGYEDWIQRVQIQANEKKVIEVGLKPSYKNEEDLFYKIFYFENCSFGDDRFDYFVKFREGGFLEGSPKPEAAFRDKEPKDFRFLDGKWSLEGKKVRIQLDSLSYATWRRVMRLEVDLANPGDDFFQATSEFSTEDGRSIRPWDGIAEKRSCQMREFPPR